MTPAERDKLLGEVWEALTQMRLGYAPPSMDAFYALILDLHERLAAVEANLSAAANNLKDNDKVQK